MSTAPNLTFQRTLEPSVRPLPHGRVKLQEMSQNQLAEATGISQATISGIENDRIRLGVERAKVLGKALKCHPAVLLFPGWELQPELVAYQVVRPDT